MSYKTVGTEHCSVPTIFPENYSAHISFTDFNTTIPVPPEYLELLDSAEKVIFYTHKSRLCGMGATMSLIN